ncbi:hypothetical protein [Sphaerisporangium sp. NPDC051011]|uniref:hypothetical protein n=1 Tax=Sphaerisporangium sp. NPDC051011 TaxID=3155792 RepID=UPI0033EE1638
MPSLEHEAFIMLFKNRPEMAAELLVRALGLTLPSYREARIESGDLTQCPPVEYQADAVVTFSDKKPVLTVVVEVQRGRDHGKRWSWPVYLAAVRARARCPAILLVICPDAPTARWCMKPIDMGHPGWRLVPLVAGPDAFPTLTDPAEAINAPELAVLSAVAHGGDLDGQPVLEAFHAALTALDDERSRLYADFVLKMLPELARKHMEELMAVGTYEYQSDFAKKYVAEGKAEAIVMILNGRGLSVSEEACSRILGCTDAAQLDIWLQRALTVASAEDVFA